MDRVASTTSSTTTAPIIPRESRPGTPYQVGNETYHVNIGNQNLFWTGNQLTEADFGDDPIFAGLSGTLDYFYNGGGRPFLATLKGSDGSGPVNLAFTLVTDPAGDIVELLDARGSAFASYRYDTLGNATIQSQGTGLISADLASEIAHDQVLRYRGHYYSCQMNLYWQDGWYDPTTGSPISYEAPLAQPEAATSITPASSSRGCCAGRTAHRRTTHSSTRSSRRTHPRA